MNDVRFWVSHSQRNRVYRDMMHSECTLLESPRVIAYVAHRRFDRGWTAGSSKPRHPSSSSSPSPFLYTSHASPRWGGANCDPDTPRLLGGCEHAISTSTSPASPVRRLRPCAGQRFSRSQTPGAQLRALTTRHSVWNACAHAHALSPHEPSLEGCERLVEVHPLRGRGAPRWGSGDAHGHWHGHERPVIALRPICSSGCRTAARLCAPWPRQVSAPSAVRVDPLPPLRPAACVGCGRLLPPGCVWSRRRGKVYRRAGLCASGPGIVGREYRWFWVPVMVFTPEPDPLELVCDSYGSGGGGSGGSLDWPAPYQVQCLVQVQLESELRLEPECA